MGKSSSTSTSQSQTAPWAQAMPEVQGLLSGVQNLIPGSGLTSAQSGAISQLTANGEAGNPYAPAIGSAATTLLNGGGATAQAPMIQSAYQNYQSALAPYLSPTYSTVNSPDVQAALHQIQTDTTDNINSQFAAAGRSGSGMNQQAIARGVAQAEAPLILAQSNQDTATRLGAANSAYGAGNTTAGLLTGLNQQGLTNMQAGIPVASSALDAQNYGPNQVLQAQQYLQSIPAQNLGLLANIGIPLAELGRSTNGTTDTTTTPSIFQDIGMLGGLIPKGPLNFSFGK